MQRHRHHLGLDHRSDVARTIRWVEPITTLARREHGRRDLRLEPGQQNASAIAGGRLLERLREPVPRQLNARRESVREPASRS